MAKANNIAFKMCAHHVHNPVVINLVLFAPKRTCRSTAYFSEPICMILRQWNGAQSCLRHGVVDLCPCRLCCRAVMVQDWPLSFHYNFGCVTAPKNGSFEAGRVPPDWAPSRVRDRIQQWNGPRFLRIDCRRDWPGSANVWGSCVHV